MFIPRPVWGDIWDSLTTATQLHAFLHSATTTAVTKKELIGHDSTYDNTLMIHSHLIPKRRRPPYVKERPETPTLCTVSTLPYHL